MREDGPNGPREDVVEVEGGPMDAARFQNMNVQDFLKLFPMHSSFMSMPPQGKTGSDAGEASDKNSCTNKNNANGDCGGPNNKEVVLAQAHSEGANHNGAPQNLQQLQQ